MPPSRDEIQSTLARFVSETRGVEEDDCVPEATLFEALRLESIDFLEISIRIDEEWGFPYPTDDLGRAFNQINENSTSEDIMTALAILTDDFYIEVPDDLEGVDPLDIRALDRSVRDLITFGSLVTFVEQTLTT